MQKAFTNKATILKVAGGDSPQLGTMWLFSGSVMGVRNVLAHDHFDTSIRTGSVEQLYFASMLFRRLDLAVNVEAEQLMAEISQISFKLDGNESFLNKRQNKEVSFSIKRIC